jgi:hypothetical protein
MGKYHCTIDLLFDSFGLVNITNKKVVKQLIQNQSNDLNHLVVLLHSIPE